MGVYGKRTLLVVDQQNEAVWKSVRNIDRLNTTLAHQLNTYDLLNAEALVLTAGRPRAGEGGLREMNRMPAPIVRKVLITEKGTVLREMRNQYFFEVARDANKIEIKRAIENDLQA